MFPAETWRPGSYSFTASVLSDFRYAEIRRFGRDALKVAVDRAERPRRICSPVHGPGYGLDESEAFLSLIGGFSDAIRDLGVGELIEEIIVLENNPRRAEYFSTLLNEIAFGDKKQGTATRTATAKTSKRERQLDRKTDDTLSNYGRASEHKTRLFVAMPFKKDYSDEWEISITEAARAADILCERIDEQSYTGDILAQIKKRIGQYNGVIALLNESNPNVFLELGFAWAKEKPTILIAKEGERLPFDVRGQRCIMYSTIADLRKKLTTELTKLKESGDFD